MKKISARFILLTIFIISLVAIFPAAAKTVVIDFEQTTDGTKLLDDEILTNQYPGLTFSGDTGDGYLRVYSKNSHPYFTPSSGDNGIICPWTSDARIDFAVPVSRVKLTHLGVYNPILKAYDSSGNLIDTVFFNSRQAQIVGSNIKYITLSIGHGGDCIIFDDLEYDTPDIQTGIPEYPNIVLPIAAIIGLMFIFQRRKK